MPGGFEARALTALTPQPPGGHLNHLAALPRLRRALASGRPIWLCWKLGEHDIAWWHELEAGVAGRRALIELE